MAAKKMTRKEIVQEDAIRRTLTDTSHWAVENIRLLLAAGGVILVAGIGFLIWQDVAESRQERMQAAFAEALETYHASVEGEATERGPAEAPVADQPEYEFDSAEERYSAALEAFQKVYDDYKGNRIGDLAGYYAGLSMLQLEQSEAAVTQLEEVIADTAYLDIRNFARNARAQAAISRNNYQEARDVLNAILEEPSENFPRELILMRLAQTLEASGDVEGALERYRQVTNEFAGSSLAGDAQMKVRQLEIRTGESGAEALAPTEGAAAPPEMP